ncbi:hypothetical protein [Phytohabitans houttuyneae]|uniref:hypothetical protein n=1 Tax=Phytohabitans houttuyneae TaxID=1076126 RepID=UPI001565399B|nr:hypothetical protein [Phytohabitans houttuyneae]
MSMMDAQEVRRASRLLAPGIPVVVFVLDFFLLFASYVLLSWVAPGLLGDVADRRAWFAAWISLVKAPITFVWVMAGSWRGWAAAMRNGEVGRPEVLTGRRRVLARVRNDAVEVASLLVAALIVFTRVRDPGDVGLWLVVAVTAAVPLLLPLPVQGPGWLVRRWWRARRGRRPSSTPGGSQVDDHQVDGAATV